MTLTKRQVSKLNKIIAAIQVILKQAEIAAAREAAMPKKVRSGRRGRRRTAVEAAKMREDILTRRKKGVAVTKLAEKYGVSTAYIYMIK
jgi:hypothetical protein